MTFVICTFYTRIGQQVISLDKDDKTGIEVWDRKAEGRFPEAPELKQKIRDMIAPEHDLGHSEVQHEH